MIWSALNISIFICRINQFKYIQFISITIYWVPAIVELWSNWSKGKRLQMKQEDTDKQANNQSKNLAEIKTLPLAEEPWIKQ